MYGAINSYHPHHSHDLFWPKALIYKHLMMFMQSGVKQNEKQLWYQSHYEP